MPAVAIRLSVPLDGGFCGLARGANLLLFGLTPAEAFGCGVLGRPDREDGSWQNERSERGDHGLRVQAGIVEEAGAVVGGRGFEGRPRSVTSV